METKSLLTLFGGNARHQKREEIRVHGDSFLDTVVCPIPTDFVALAGKWCANQSVVLLTLVWKAYDLLLTELPAGIDSKDLERSITQSLELRIDRVMSGDEPFQIQHGPFERESMQSPPAQPPQYDLAFVLSANELIMWPLEAKVLETDSAVSEYVKGVNKRFLSCYYAPFSSEGAMLGYLLSGTPGRAFDELEAKIPCTLAVHPGFVDRAARVSDHTRQVEPQKAYPINFRCHHLILEFIGFSRFSSTTTRLRRRRVAIGAASLGWEAQGVGDS
jgi:hypothetical protein